MKSTIPDPARSRWFEDMASSVSRDITRCQHRANTTPHPEDVELYLRWVEEHKRELSELLERQEAYLKEMGAE